MGASDFALADHSYDDVPPGETDPELKHFTIDGDRQWNMSIPAACVISAKMTGAPSTKPPAVIGRESASFTGAWAPPVLMPLCRSRTGSFSAGFCWASPELRSNVKQMACIAVARRRYPDWLDREDGIRPQVCGLTQQASSHKVGEEGSR